MKYTEDDVKSIKAVGHLIEYTLIKPGIQAHEIWRCSKELEEAQELIEKKGIPESLASECIELDSVKKLVKMLIICLQAGLDKK